MAAATAIAATSLLITAGTTAVSFAQASKQRKKMDAANQKAEEMMMEARKKLDKNVFEDLDVDKELYQQEQDRINEQAQLAMQLGAEGETRGAGATAGRIQLATQEAQNRVRAQQESNVNRIEEMVAKEDSRLRDLNVQLDLAEVQGAQQAAKDAEVARAQAISQGIQGIASTAQQGLGMVPLFSAGSAKTQRGVVDSMDLGTISKDSAFNVTTGTGKNAVTTPVTFDVGTQKGVTLDQIKFGDLTNKEFKQFRSSLNPLQDKALFGSNQFTTGIEQATGGGAFAQNFAAGGAGGTGGTGGLTLAQIQQLKALGII